MPKQRSEDSMLVSAARALGATLGRVKRLTTEGAPAARKRSSGARTRQQRSSAKIQPATSSTRQPRTRLAKPRATNRPIPPLEEADMAAAQAGASRSPRQTESSRRGKSRSKRSKSRRASRRR